MSLIFLSHQRKTALVYLQSPPLNEDTSIYVVIDLHRAITFVPNCFDSRPTNERFRMNAHMREFQTLQTYLILLVGQIDY